jgi:hypothetical protein
MVVRDWQNEEWLKNQYINLGRNVAWIADMAKVHPDIIRFYLDQYKIYRPLPKCEHGFVMCQKCKVYQ